MKTLDPKKLIRVLSNIPTSTDAALVEGLRLLTLYSTEEMKEWRWSAEDMVKRGLLTARKRRRHA